MDNIDSRFRRIESQLDSMHAWQVETSALQAEMLTSLKNTNKHIFTYGKEAKQDIDDRLDKLEDDMNMWKKLAAGIAVISSGITAAATWWINKQ